MKKFKSLLSFLIAIVFMGCGTSHVNQTSQSIIEPREIIHFGPDKIEIEGDLKSFKASWETEKISEGLQTITLTLNSPTAATPPEFSLKWNFPSVDIYSFWNSNVSVDQES